MHRIAFVVPTKDRRDDLRAMLASLSAQSRKPDQVIVVDGSEPVVRDIVDAFGTELRIEYVRVYPPSLSQQRNAGMKRLGPDITVAGYLDDDIVLEREAVERMLDFWEHSAPDVGGVAFNIINSPPPGAAYLKRFFAIDHATPGLVLASGFPSTIPAQVNDIETDWLFGGATVWRKEVVEAFTYDEWFVGTGFMEDVDFSFNVRGSYRLALAAGARLAHYSRPVRSDRQYLLGWWQVANRMYFVRKYRKRGLSLAAAWWASLGLVLLNSAAALKRRDMGYLNRARGNLMGIVATLTGRATQTGGHLK